MYFLNKASCGNKSPLSQTICSLYFAGLEWFKSID